MGAQQFITEARGKTPSEAFWTAVEDANYEHGRGGYTGTIAEKNEFLNINFKESEDPYSIANKMIDDSDPRIDDKWGPAGCIDISRTSYAAEKLDGLNTYLFFGWASS